MNLVKQHDLEIDLSVILSKDHNLSSSGGSEYISGCVPIGLNPIPTGLGACSSGAIPNATDEAVGGMIWNLAVDPIVRASVMVHKARGLYLHVTKIIDYGRSVSEERHAKI